MTPRPTIEDLEKTFLTNNQLANVAIQDNHEPLVNLKELDSSLVLKAPQENIPYTGNTIYLRESVTKKILNIQNSLSKRGLGLKITDGYRPLQIQKHYWNEELEKVKQQNPHLSKEDREEKASIFIAKPELSLHPTGGAVDLTIVDTKTNQELKMGTPIDEFTEKSYTGYTHFPKEVIHNRNILFSIMEQQGFYNLPSEWWHFSYGTIDWALHYKKEFAIYNIVNLKA